MVWVNDGSGRTYFVHSSGKIMGVELRSMVDVTDGKVETSSTDSARSVACERRPRRSMTVVLSLGI